MFRFFLAVIVVLKALKSASSLRFGAWGCRVRDSGLGVEKGARVHGFGASGFAISWVWGFRVLGFGVDGFGILDLVVWSVGCNFGRGAYNTDKP